jgi:hypothetical protein
MKAQAITEIRPIIRKYRERYLAELTRGDVDAG